jgi:hypothetical protein
MIDWWLSRSLPKALAMLPRPFRGIMEHQGALFKAGGAVRQGVSILPGNGRPRMEASVSSEHPTRKSTQIQIKTQIKSIT